MAPNLLLKAQEPFWYKIIDYETGYDVDISRELFDILFMCDGKHSLNISSEILSGLEKEGLIIKAEEYNKE